MKSIIWQGKKRNEQQKFDWRLFFATLFDLEFLILLAIAIAGLVIFFTTFKLIFLLPLLVVIFYFLLFHVIPVMAARQFDVFYSLTEEGITFFRKTPLGENEIFVSFQEVQDIRFVKYGEQSGDIFLMGKKSKPWLGDHYPTLFLEFESEKVGKLIYETWRKTKEMNRNTNCAILST